MPKAVHGVGVRRRLPLPSRSRPPLCRPKDGEYTIEIRTPSIGAARISCYRIAIGELPFVTSAFPLGGRAGSKTTIQLTGWNSVPATKMTMNAKGKAAGVYRLPTSRRSWWTPCPKALKRSRTTPPRRRSASSSYHHERTHRSTGDWDVFRFQGRAGEATLSPRSMRAGSIRRSIPCSS